jgi:hypothetical protein
MNEKLLQEEWPIGTINDKGQEVPDPRPVEIPAGFKIPESLDKQIARLVAGRLSDIAEENGFESFEESEDFDVEDPEDVEIDTPYEMHFDPMLGDDVSHDMLQRNPDHYKRRYIDAAATDEVAEHIEAEGRKKSFFDSFRRKPKAAENQPTVEKDPPPTE